ncbi:deoxyguanosinetriphosphate triphosphohydrolase [Echinicola strongylocentroti]|uniref:Deoxyguanosinetriphosphate triphosphohydrolase n=2 Tax=Echinicola strongylocentroti TaxID=1795355 RepID=A0A2Z4IQY4_9BACT|nr:deoxyguanosinetriphosphate triphosphohydrolase [Echinicola strongylocentroti]AWW33140.1 deoxyguanosinetriphosphate triphosphohydrolase [Echinicola strongylocentroti]
MKWEQLLSAGRADFKKKSKASQEQYRSEFERDYDRIIFSAPFRNLQDKTQVFPLPELDFVHTRLTHSLEVSSVGRSLGKSAGEYLLEKYPELNQRGVGSSDIGAIVAAAALTHDIGNPPFGHAGEDAISDFFKFHPSGQVWKTHLRKDEWEDMINFEGNAQGFRMLVDKDNGLQVCYATLAAFTKYPRPALIDQRDPDRRSQKKFGFFSNHLGVYQQLADMLGLSLSGQNSWHRHPLAFLVEAADDICYSIIDLEDGCTLGLVQLEEAIPLLAEIIGDKFQEEKLNSLKSSAQKLAILRAMAIGKLVEETVATFRLYEEAMLKGEFDQALTDCIPSADALEKITKLSVKKIYRSQPVLEKEAAGFQVLEGLLEVFSTALYNQYYDTQNFSGKDKSILRLLPETFKMNKEMQMPYILLRNLIDFISGMTDKYALSLYRKVKGIALPGT